MSASSINSTLDTNLNSGPISKPELVTALKTVVTSVEADIAAVASQVTSGAGTASPAGVNGDIQIKSGSTLAAIPRTGGSAVDYLARDNTYKALPTGGGATGTVVTGNAATFDTLADLEAADVNAAINFVQTAGYYAVGDAGAAQYRRKAANEPDYELDRTSNGGTVKWELVPWHGTEIWLEQAGAKSSSTFNTQDNDVYPCFRAIDKFAAAKGLAGYTLRISGGWYFSSKAWHLKRITTHIKGTYGGSGGGRGTVIRFPADQSGIITNYKWGAGHDYSIAIPNFGINKGGGNYVPDGYTNRGAVYRCLAAGTSPADGAASLTSTDKNTPFTWGTATMVYEGDIVNDPVPGGGIMDYDVGGDDNHAANNCTIEGLELWGFFDPRDPSANAGLWKINNAGIVMRSRASIINCWVLAFAGHGIAVVADGDTDLQGPGNVNGWRLDRIGSYYNGKDGVHVGYSDANAGTGNDIDTMFNNRWGIADWNFLNNTWTSMQSAYDGRGYSNTRQYYPQCQYQGWIYLSRLPIIGSENWPAYKNEVPGGSNNAWIRYYKGYADLVNAAMAYATTKADGTSITLGAALSGKQTFDAAGAVGNTPYHYLITDGANYEQGVGWYYPAGYDANTPVATLTRSQHSRYGQTGGVAASSATQSTGAAAGLPALLTLTSAATVKLIAPVQDSENAPYWHPDITFEPNGAYSTNNINSRTLFMGPYIEGGTPPAQWCFPTTVIGGIMGDAYDTSRGANIFTENRWLSLSTQQSIQADDGTYPKFNVIINGAPVPGSPGGVVMGWQDYSGQAFVLRQDHTGSGVTGFDGGDIILDQAGQGFGNSGPPYFRIKSGGTAGYGRTAAGWNNKRPMVITDLIIGGAFGIGRHVTFDSVPPDQQTGNTLEYAQGEFCFNIAPGAGGIFGWTCVTGGNPGTWKAVRGIDA